MSDTLRVGIAGLGTVGAETFRLLQRNDSIIHSRCGRSVEVVAVSARDQLRDRGIDISACRWYSDAGELAACNDLDVVVETIGGAEGIAKEVCDAALGTGKHLVTANKALIATHGTVLSKQAEEKGVALAFEAAVAGGVPVIKTLRESLAGNRVTKIAGVLNGTSNFILTEMEQHGSDFDSTLKEAQALGYAEVDPTFDIDGTDAAQKLAIMSMIAFGCTVEEEAVFKKGITHITSEDMKAAAETGQVVRLVGVAEHAEGRVSARVQPCLLPKSSPLNVSGVMNTVLIEGDAVGRLVLEGPGAGAGATASSVASDIIDIARGNYTFPFGAAASSLKNADIVAGSDMIGDYFIRCEVNDKKGAESDINAVFDVHGSVVEHYAETGQHIALSVRGIKKDTANKLYDAISALEYVTHTPSVIAMETI